MLNGLSHLPAAPSLACRRPPKSNDVYVPRIFGFKLHPSAYGNREPAPARNSQRRIASAPRGEGAAAAAAAGGAAGAAAAAGGKEGQAKEDDSL